MAHDDVSALLPFIIPAIATVIAAWLATRGGHKAAAKDEGLTPREHGEHAHTRDVIDARIALAEQRILDRLALSDMARGLRSQSEQIGISARRVLDNQEEAE